MKVFADLHHSGLFHSLKLLFENRLGGSLYRPVGLEWAEQGYWQIHKPYNYSMDTANQYLKIDPYYRPIDGSLPLNSIMGVTSTHYEVEEKAHNYTQKAVTLEQFMSMDIDIVIASIPDHVQTFEKLRLLHPKRPKLIFQMGNMFTEVHDLLKRGAIRNLMASTIQFDTPSGVNKVFYHQEVDQEVFAFRPPIANRTVSSFVHLLPQKETFEAYRSALPEYTFKAYGSGCPDGLANGIQEVADRMEEAGWGFHVKPRGDGFGHVLFSWGFVGRPIITNFSDYADKLGGEILIDGVTAHNLEGRTVLENCERIRALSDPAYHFKMCQAINDITHSKIDYDKEQQLIEEFINRLI
jgi:hypothetical protein